MNPTEKQRDERNRTPDDLVIQLRNCAKQSGQSFLSPSMIQRCVKEQLKNLEKVNQAWRRSQKEP